MILRTVPMDMAAHPTYAVFFDANEPGEEYSLTAKDWMLLIWKILAERRLVGIVMVKRFRYDPEEEAI